MIVFAADDVVDGWPYCGWCGVRAGLVDRFGLRVFGPHTTPAKNTCDGSYRSPNTRPVEDSPVLDRAMPQSILAVV